MLLVFPRTKTLFVDTFVLQWTQTIENTVLAWTNNTPMVDFILTAKRDGKTELKILLLDETFVCNGINLSTTQHKNIFIKMYRNPTMLHAIRAFQRRFRRWFRFQQQRTALMMAFHPRLGAHSRISMLDEDILNFCMDNVRMQPKP